MSQFSILFICTGNVCRSPLAELLIRASINAPEISTSSVGTQALVGQQMPEIQQDIAQTLGVSNPEDHRARQLTLKDVESADLILTMERQHRSETVQLSPRALRRTFTLREIARISSLVPDEDLTFEVDDDLVARLIKLVEAAAINRGLAVPIGNPTDDDVVDPFRRSKQTYLESRDQIIMALNELVEFLNRAAD